MKIMKHDVIAQCSDLMLAGDDVGAIEALELAQEKGVDVTEDEVTNLYELKLSINYELVA